ncbi:MAG: hypothetical protein KDE15_04920 [Erythrobacter sp.]|nr:hypothetical protein [Erythrobacter sp.]
MAQQLSRQQIAAQADIYANVPHTSHEVDRTFEMPKGLYLATVALYLGFILTMALTFSSTELVLPYAAFVLIIVAGFGVPTIWARMAPETRSTATSWARFQQEGIQTAYGRTSARDAAVQVLILPVLIFLWGVTAVIIAALV